MVLDISALAAAFSLLRAVAHNNDGSLSDSEVRVGGHLREEEVQRADGRRKGQRDMARPKVHF